MSNRGWICEICRGQDATNFCLCEMILVCGQCRDKHMEKKRGDAHVCYPDSVAAFRSVPGYFDRLQQRTRSINIGSAELRSNMQRVDQCIEEFEGKLEALITGLREYGLAEKQRLMSLKEGMRRDIDESLAEAKETEFVEQPTLKTRYAAAIRDGANPAQLRLFDYQINVKENVPQSAIEIKLSAGGDSSGTGWDFLPQIRGNTLRVYSIATEQTSSLTLPVAFTNYSVFCLTEPDSVLCVGGCPATANSYLINMRSLNVKTTQPMLIARGCPGIIKKGSNVYVFGGYSQNALAGCEKFGLVNEAWTRLRDMQKPKSHFCPCSLGDDIILIDVAQFSRTIEVFNVATETFKNMPGTFPTSLGNASSISLVVDSELIVLTCKRQMARMKLNSEASFRVADVANRDKESGYSSTGPVTVGRNVYWIRWNDGAVVKFSMDSLRIID